MNTENPPLKTDTPKQEKDKLIDLVNRQEEILFVTDTVFPFDFFPARLTVERNKIDLVRTIFLTSRQVKDILISHVARVEESSSLFFSTLTIYSTIPGEEPFKVEYLLKSAGLKARRMIEGLMITQEEKIDPLKIPQPQLIQNLQKIGAAK